ncbi:hypothetical protein [Streptomyces antimicrobicus]|uniref:Uncharacterized protein n=1 Tax=Streptomyces antimicrobicus TaxID=2883108 RepID=A0ABS8BB66_9ACTN|nr:hypothetical protein [Streptomyces antimicrobicus]MCB5181873.1 hypothetical protein [Streptomyces antimicrobicus]
MSWHRDTVALTEISLRLVSAEDVEVRARARVDPTVALMPPLVPLGGGLSLVQQRIVCDAVGCPPDSRHRRRQQAALGPVRP